MGIGIGGNHMFKKVFAILFSSMLAFIGFVGFAHAATPQVTDKMTKHYLDQFKSDHYDYAKGSLKFTNVEQINLNKPIEIKQGDNTIEVTKVTAAVATFKTVRDKIFFKDWKQTVFYSTDQNIALTTGDTLGVKQLQKYSDQNPSGVSMELWAIGTLLLLVFVIPAAFVFIWSKYQYSTLGFKIKNKLYYGTTTDQTFN